MINIGVFPCIKEVRVFESFVRGITGISRDRFKILSLTTQDETTFGIKIIVTIIFRRYIKSLKGILKSESGNVYIRLTHFWRLDDHFLFFPNLSLSILQTLINILFASIHHYQSQVLFNFIIPICNLIHK